MMRTPVGKFLPLLLTLLLQSPSLWADPLHVAMARQTVLHHVPSTWEVETAEECSFRDLRTPQSPLRQYWCVTAHDRFSHGVYYSSHLAIYVIGQDLHTVQSLFTMTEPGRFNRLFPNGLSTLIVQHMFGTGIYYYVIGNIGGRFRKVLSWQGKTNHWPELYDDPRGEEIPGIIAIQLFSSFASYTGEADDKDTEIYRWDSQRLHYTLQTTIPWDQRHTVLPMSKPRAILGEE